MNNSGLDNNSFVSEIIRSGSNAIKTRNDKNVHIFNTNVNNRGLVSGKLTRPNYDIVEVKKSIDTNIVELISVEAPELPRTVLKTVFDAVVNENTELENDILNLNNRISELENKVISLEIVSESLRFELDAKDILLSAEQNQNQLTSNKVQSTIIDLQNAIQRATNEAIQRVSLAARNEALQEQIRVLNNQLSDLNNQLNTTIETFNRERQDLSNRINQTQQQLSEQQKQNSLQQTISDELSKGAFGSNSLTARPFPIIDTLISPIAWRGRPTDNFNNTDTKWINGNSINIFNPSNNTVTVTFTQSIDFLRTINNISIPAGKSATVSLNVDIKKVEKFVRINDTLNVGELSIITPNTTVKIPMELQIQRGSNYDRKL